jgi:hypothetical protein
LLFISCNEYASFSQSNNEINLLDNARKTFSLTYPDIEPPGDNYKPPKNSYSVKAPQIAEWTKTAGEDENIILSGYNLQHSDFEIYSNEGINQANVQYRDNEKAIITINKSFKKWSQFLIWPKDVHGYGKPVAVNKTEVWWVGPEISRINDVVSIYGRNLTHNNDTLISYVYLRSIKSKKTMRVKINKANPYKVDFVVPDVLQGIYELWVHNGHGGKWGWSDPILISIEKPINWGNEIFSFNVQTQSPSSLQNIIDKASEYAFKNKTFATVKLSEGTLYISTSIKHKSRVQIKGVRNRTVIKCASEFENKNGMIQSANSEYISLSDLTIDASGKTDFVNGVINYREKNNFIWLNNVSIISRGEKSFDFHNSAFIFIIGGEVTGGGLGKENFFGTARQVLIDNVIFKMSDLALMALKFQGGSCISITNSSCFNLGEKRNEKGMGRFIVIDGSWGYTSNIYIGQNITAGLESIKEVDDNMGEQILWEGHYGRWKGPVQKASSNTLELSDLTLDGTSFGVTIVKGKGFGQTRKILKNELGILTIKDVLNVIPDSTSWAQIGAWNEKSVVYKNSFYGTRRVVTQEEHSASAAVEAYGGVFDLIVDGNKISYTRYGIRNFVTMEGQNVDASSSKGKTVDPHYFHLYQNNLINNCRWGITQTSLHSENDGIGIFGCIYRNNKVSNSIISDVVNEVDKKAYGTINTNVFEHNELQIPAAMGGLHQIFYKNAKKK